MMRTTRSMSSRGICASTARTSATWSSSAAAIVDRLRKAPPDLDIISRDIATTPLAHLSGPHLAAAQCVTPELGMLQDVAAGQAALRGMTPVGSV